MTKKRAAKTTATNRSPGTRLDNQSVTAHKSMPDSKSDSTPAKRPVIPSATSAERPLVNSKIMAFRLGRRSNEFRFHLLQAFLLYANKRSERDHAAWDELELANKVLRSLIQEAVLIAGARSEALSSAIEEIRLRLMYFGQAGHQEELNEVSERRNADEGVLRDYWSKEELCESPQIVEHLRNTLLTYVADRDQHLFFLGELIDQGIRPLGMKVRFRALPGKKTNRLGTINVPVNKKQGSLPVSSSASKPSDHTEGVAGETTAPDGEQDSEAEFFRRLELAEYTCWPFKPGQAHPGQAWFDAMKSALEGIGRTDLGKDLQPRKRSAASGFLGNVKHLESSIERELAHGSATPKIDFPFNQAETKILTVLMRAKQRLTETQILNELSTIGEKEPATRSMKDALVRLQLRKFIDNDRDELGRGYMLLPEIREAIATGEIRASLESHRPSAVEP